MRTWPTRWLLVALTLCLVPGCDGDGGSADDAGPPDGMDAGPGDAGGPTDAGAPDAGWVDVTLYTPVSLSDDELADQAVAILVGTPEQPRCTTCHGLVPSVVQRWGTETTDALACVAGLEPNLAADATAILGCFTDETTGMADPARLGLVSTASHLGWFQRAFDVEHQADSPTERAIFLMTGHMPRPPGIELTQDEVDVLLSWAVRGLPGMNERLAVEGGLDCELTIEPEVNAHIALMQTEGWAVRNRDAAIAMHGCAAGQTGRDCLSAYPDVSTVPAAAGWAHAGNLRILHEYDFSSSYWAKASADGRYIGMGGSDDGAGANSTIIDLERQVEIPTHALYDPGFFPDNGGFIFQGTGGGVAFCRQSLLNGMPARIDFSEPECTSLGNQVGLYQHIGRVAGGDFWTVYGQFVSDNGGHSVRRSYLAVDFNDRSATSFRPIVDEGSTFSAGSRVRVNTPFEGDAVLSPSGRLAMLRARGTGGVPAGYVLRAVQATPNAGGYDVTAPQIGRYCGRGGKVSFSYDERYVVYHRYITDDEATELGFIGVGDPAFSDYRMMGGSNVYLLDLFSGVSRRITHMAPGQYALFPHFRSDGWIYFQVRATVADGRSHEYFVASDAALPDP